jgi:hypothetical protein
MKENKYSKHETMKGDKIANILVKKEKKICDLRSGSDVR